MGKVVEIFVAKQLSQYNKRYSKLYLSLISGFKEKSAINKVIIFEYKVQKIWKIKMLAIILFINVRDVSDYVSNA